MRARGEEASTLLYFQSKLFATLVCKMAAHIISSLEPGSPPTLYRIRNKKGESLEDFDHVLDMVGHGWAWSRILSAKTEVLTDLCPS